MVRTLSPDKKKALLDSALKLFVKNGVQHTSTAEIAKEAGTAAGTLFLYFPTKQDLLDELVLQVGQEQSDAIRSQIDPSFSARETFLTIWNGTLGWFQENVDAYQYVQQVRDTGLITAAAIQESGKFFGYYYEAIQKGHAEGSIKPYPLELIGEILYQDLVAVMTIIRMQTDRARREEMIQQGFDIYWNGIKSEQAIPSGENHEL